MGNTKVVQFRGRSFGLVVKLSQGRFRFFASAPAADPIDGSTFRSVAATVRAVAALTGATARTVSSGGADRLHLGRASA